MPRSVVAKSKKIHMSKQAREVVNHLADLGVEVAMGEDQLFDIEVCCSRWYASHILTVIKTVLSGGHVIRKLHRAQGRGWSYFARPTRDMLKSRDNAQRKDWPDEEIMEGWAAKVYSIVMTTLVPHDINRAEANSLIYGIPQLVFDRNDLVMAIGICKRQDARSISYLAGVLMREDARREARHAEHKKMTTGELWEPDHPPMTEEEADQIVESWNIKSRNISINKALRDYASDT